MHRHSIEVSTTEQTYYMYASSEKDKDEWIGAIGRYLNLIFLNRSAIVQATIAEHD